MAVILTVIGGYTQMNPPLRKLIILTSAMACNFVLGIF